MTCVRLGRACGSGATRTRIRTRVLWGTWSILALGAALVPQAAQAESYSAATNFAAGTQPSSVAVGDLNADAKVDLAVANAGSNNVSILLGNGDGTFSGPTNFPAGTQPASVTVGNFSTDTNADLAVANRGSNNVSILLGHGDGTFSLHGHYGAGTQPASVAAGSFNADGNPDLAVANRGSSNVSILLGNGDAEGTFSAAANFAVGSQPASIAVGNFNGDTNADLAVANESFPYHVSILLGNGDGTFSTAPDVAVSAQPVSVALGDFNADGKLDLVTVSPNTIVASVRLGNGDGTFSSPSNPNPDISASGYAVAVGNFNGDGRLDFVAAIPNYAATVLGFGGGTFAQPTRFPVGSFPVSVAVGNFNSDSHPDLVTANSGSNNVSILLNNTFVYARPKGATPLSVSLVPAYRACTSSNANQAHGLPLAYPSCEPPVQTSRYLSVGTPDANGAPANSTGTALFATITGDVRIRTSITDVRCYPGIVSTCGAANAAGGADYTGQVQLTTQLRSSDTYNGEFAGVGVQPAVARDTSFAVTIPCTETPDDAIGGGCAISTTANALVAGSVKGGARTIWQLGQVQVMDGGFDGDVSTKGEGDGLFEVQGLFVP